MDRVVKDRARGSTIFSLLDSDNLRELITLVFMQLNNCRWIVICSKVCKKWKWAIDQNIIWRHLCEKLWADKVYVPLEYHSLHQSGRSKDAYIGSLLDSRRTTVSTDELTQMTFDFRFKRTAGSYWTEMDPFWISNKPLQIRFGHGNSVSGFPWDTLRMKWHFVDPRGHLCQSEGSFLRVSVNERCVPTYKISRHSNWGFILQVSRSSLGPQAPSMAT